MMRIAEAQMMRRKRRRFRGRHRRSGAVRTEVDAPRFDLMSASDDLRQLLHGSRVICDAGNAERHMQR
jgi:hypothetical protein